MEGERKNLPPDASLDIISFSWLAFLPARRYRRGGPKRPEAAAW
jgi:hypothetical protein